jgi:hypothetical protein
VSIAAVTAVALIYLSRALRGRPGGP